MPTISIFYGIIIVTYFRNKEHNPPHIHAIINDFDVPFLISNGEIIEGEFPARKVSSAESVGGSRLVPFGLTDGCVWYHLE